MPSAAVSFHRQIVFGAYLKQNFFTCQGKQEELERLQELHGKEAIVLFKYVEKSLSQLHCLLF